MSAKRANNVSQLEHLSSMNSLDYPCYTAGLGEACSEIEYSGDEARELLNLLFCDFPRSEGPVLSRRFGVVFAGSPARMSLWLGEKQIYFGESKQLLAQFLMNEILYDCIISNTSNQAIHAAAISSGGKGLLLPGKSGSGKSSLAAWLTASGMNYLTDELAFLSRKGFIHPMTRPICLKQPSYEALQKRLSIDETNVLRGQDGAMIPHRLLNPMWNASTPRLDAIVFPTFVKDHPTTLTEISTARSCLKLMECHVNARNLPGHGFSEIAAITRNISSYELTFGSYDGVLDLLLPLL